MKYLTTNEVAKKLKVHNMTVWRWIKTGKLPAVSMGEGPGVRYRVKLSDLNEFKEKIKPFLNV